MTESNDQTKAEAHASELGVSREEKARLLIERAGEIQASLGSLARRCFGPENGVDLELPPRNSHQPMDLNREFAKNPFET